MGQSLRRSVVTVQYYRLIGKNVRIDYSLDYYWSKLENTQLLFVYLILLCNVIVISITSPHYIMSATCTCGDGINCQATSLKLKRSLRSRIGWTNVKIWAFKASASSALHLQVQVQVQVSIIVTSSVKPAFCKLVLVYPSHNLFECFYCIKTNKF